MRRVVIHLYVDDYVCIGIYMYVCMYKCIHIHTHTLSLSLFAVYGKYARSGMPGPGIRAYRDRAYSQFYIYQYISRQREWSRLTDLYNGVVAELALTRAKME